MIKNLNLLILIFCCIYLYSCSTAKDALQGKKRSEQSDEFLVKKKNPLILPPDFEKLPIPGNEEQNSNVDRKSSDIKELLSLEDLNQSNEKDSDQPADIESSILKKIQ